MIEGWNIDVSIYVSKKWELNSSFLGKMLASADLVSKIVSKIEKTSTLAGVFQFLTSYLTQAFFS